MTKNILLTEIIENDMGLSMKKLLCEHFSKEDVQDALRDIGEPTSGTKEELCDELVKNWESFNRDKYELLDFTDEETLQQICHYYNLDATPADHDVLKRRIKKANLLGSSGKPKPTAHVNRSHDSFITKPKPSSVVDDILSYSKRPKINTEENSETPVHINIGSITHSKWGKIGAVSTIVGIVIMIILALAV